MIKTNKIITAAFIVTFIMLMYVNQQTLIYQMGLKVKENQGVYSKLVDRNRVLVYNVLNHKSPVSLQTKLLARNVELGMPHKWQVVKLESSPVKITHKKATKGGFFASLLAVGREAEASPYKNVDY